MCALRRLRLRIDRYHRTFLIPPPSPFSPRLLICSSSAIDFSGPVTLEIVCNRIARNDVGAVGIALPWGTAGGESMTPAQLAGVVPALFRDWGRIGVEGDGCVALLRMVQACGACLSLSLSLSFSFSKPAFLATNLC